VLVRLITKGHFSEIRVVAKGFPLISFCGSDVTQSFIMGKLLSVKLEHLRGRARTLQDYFTLGSQPEGQSVPSKSTK
jgi:hypothetical protein